MKNFIKLLNFEINRFMKIYISMLLIVFIVQLSTVILNGVSYMIFASDVTKDSRLSPEQFLEEYWPFSLADVVYSIGFLAPVMLSVGGLLFYMFFIWYRDWFARNTFIYRLLMLPTSRMNIYFAKLAAIMMMVFGMVAFQIIYLVIYEQVIKWIVPVVYRLDIRMGLAIESSDVLHLLIPNSVSSFVIAYGIGLTFVVVMFTIILFERSFKWIGIIIGGIYALITLGLFTLPAMVQFIFLESFYLYNDEMFYVQTAIIIVIIGISLWISHYLINKKVTV